MKVEDSIFIKKRLSQSENNDIINLFQWYPPI